MTSAPISYHRIILDPRNKHLFVYVAALEGSNAIQVGLGYASENELQRKHVCCLNVHHFDAEAQATVFLADDDLCFGTGPLSEHFGAGLVHVEKQEATMLASALLAAKEKAFGYHVPGAIHRFKLDRHGERFVYFKHDKRRDELQIGLAGVTDGLIQIGEPQFRLRPDDAPAVKAFVHTWNGGQPSVIFDKAPANWGEDRGAVLNDDGLIKAGAILARITEALWNI